MKSRRHRSPRTDNLKCVRYHNGHKMVVVRLPNDDADRLVRTHAGAKYIPKQEWRNERNIR